MNPSAKISDDPAGKSARKKWKTKLKKPDEEKLPENFNVPGVKRVVLTRKTQEEIQCVVGENITRQDPWKFVPKELVEDSITFNENSEFSPLKTDITAYPRSKLLFGYTADDERDYDEFYLCLTENAEDAVHDTMRRLKREQDAAIASTQCRSPGKWLSLGSELELDESTERTNRALLEVEIETAYPIMSQKARFKTRPPDEAKDGYEELLTPLTRLSFQVLRKKRTSLATQVTPSAASRSSQTDFAFPKNTWTQYLFEYREIKESFTGFTSEYVDEVCDHLQVNYDLNFYFNDYHNLIGDPRYTVTPEEIRWEEYMSFADLQDARGKMVASVSWHPMWTGTVAIAYSNIAPNVHKRGGQTLDEVNAVMHEANPILIWCFDDGLKPKLHLECHKQVECISFCPFDQNIIVGASRNGQVIVWDIRNKLEKVEEVEVLTTAQQKYRVMMRLLMNWMKNAQDVSHVRATIESDLVFSHSTAATGILWIPPYVRMTNLGKYELIEQGKPPSMQVATCSLDGTVLFWDLLSQINPAEYKPRKPPQRLKVRPSALTTDVLNRKWKPFYKLSFSSLKTSGPHLLSSVASYPLNVTYENPERRYNQRVAYKPVISPPSSPLPLEIYCGSCDGYMLKATWEGCDYEVENSISQENCVLVSVGKFHDGPIVCIERHPVLLDTYLTVGGRAFAIWKDTFKDKPVLWRKSRSEYTHGNWDKHNASIRLCRSDGNREVWNFLKHSEKICYEQSISGEAILGSYLHTLGKANVLGVSDYNGAFRMFYLPKNDGRQDVAASFSNLLDREVARKLLFAKWHHTWLEKNAHLIREKEERIQLEKQRQLEREKSERKKRREEKLRMERERRRLAALKEKAPPGEYFRWAAEKWGKDERDRMHLGLLRKKGLNPEALGAQQMPLKKLEQAEENKKKKQAEVVQNAEKIFGETVGMVFPVFIKEKPPPPWNPYGGGCSPRHKRRCVDEYDAATEEASHFIRDNPFEYDFDWKRLIHQRRNRRSETEGRRKIRRQRTEDDS